MPPDRNVIPLRQRAWLTDAETQALDRLWELHNEGKCNPDECPYDHEVGERE